MRRRALTLLGAAALTAALLAVSNDGHSGSLASAAQKIALIRASTDPGGVRLDLYVMNADGNGSRRLEIARSSSSTPDEYELGSSLAWSPDGRKIAFVGMGDDGNTDVYVMRADGRGQQRLTRHPAVDGNPAWSPDGRTIAFTRGGRGCCVGKTYIYVMNADGSTQRRLALGHVHFSVAWSPDGRKMLFERLNPRHPRGVAPGEFPEELYVMNADGSGERRLTRNPARDNGDIGQAWAPDGRKIAFSRQTNARQRCRVSVACGIWLMNPDGSGQRSLTPAGWYSTGNSDWSPDGRKIAVDGTRRWRGPASTTPSGVFVVNADGSERRRLTQGGGSPAWSPDGRKIAFDRDGEIYVMNADGSGQRRLTKVGASPTWSPDGQMIAFERDDATGTELVVMTADGRGERRLMRSDRWGGHGFEWAWSPRRS